MSDAKRVFFVTVGTTAAYVAGRSAALKTTIGGMEKNVNDWVTKAADVFYLLVEEQKKRLALDIKGGENTILGIYVSNYHRVRKDRIYYSAEITSTLLLLESGGVGGPVHLRHGTDKVVLLASDTGIGKLCARVNAQLIHDFLFATGHKCDKDFLNGDACNSVAVEVVNGLEATKEFCPIPLELERIVDKHTAEISGKGIYFNVTGGFKGTIPSVTWLCMRKGAAGLFYQHDDSETAHLLYVSPDGKGGQSLEDKHVPPPLSRLGAQ